MAATTITRTGVTLVNDTGSAATPNGDGTLLNNAWVQTFMDRIDSLISGNITFGGTITAEGFGTHAFSTGGTGGNVLLVRNTTAGTGNYAMLQARADSTTVCDLVQFSTTLTPSVYNQPDGGRVLATGAGGLHIAASHASGVVKVYTGSTERLAVDANGNTKVAYGLWLTGSYNQEITGSQTLDSGGQYYPVIRLTAATSTPKITSCTAGNDGDIKIIVNVSGAACTVQHNGGAPTTRIYLANATDGTIADDESLMLLYDAGSSSWIEVGPR